MSSTWDTKNLKGTPIAADEVLIIDTADSRNQKRATLSSFGAGIWSRTASPGFLTPKIITDTLRITNGTELLPAYSFTNFTNYGMRAETDALAFSVKGFDALKLTADANAASFLSINAGSDVGPGEGTVTLRALGTPTDLTLKLIANFGIEINSGATDGDVRIGRNNTILVSTNGAVAIGSGFATAPNVFGRVLHLRADAALFNQTQIHIQSPNTTRNFEITVEDEVNTGLITLGVTDNNTFNRSSGSFITDGFLAGQTITTSGFVNSQNNGVFVVASVSALALDITTTPLIAESQAGARNIQEVDTGDVTLVTDGEELHLDTVAGNAATIADKRLGLGGKPISDFTVFQQSDVTKKGIVLTGEGISGSSVTDGILLVAGNIAVGNMQLWVGQKSDLGNAAKNFFRYIVGHDVPTIDGVNGTNALVKNINLGGLGGNIGIGFNLTTAVQGDIVGQLHVKPNATNKIGQIIQAFGTQTVDLFQVRNSANVAQIVIDENFRLGIGVINPTVPLDVSGAVKISGDLSISANGSSEGSPRIGAFTDLTSGEAVRFQFGDSANAFQLAFDKTLDIYSFHTLRLFGDRSTTTPPVFSSESNINVHVINTIASSPALVVSGATSQTGDLLQVRNVSDTILSSFNSLGILKTPNGTAVTPSHSFVAKTNYGMYYNTSVDAVCVSNNGFDVIRLTADANSTGHLHINATPTVADASHVELRAIGPAAENDFHIRAGDGGVVEINAEGTDLAVLLGRSVRAIIDPFGGAAFGFGFAASASNTNGRIIQSRAEAALFTQTETRISSPNTSRNFDIQVKDEITTGLVQQGVTDTNTFNRSTGSYIADGFTVGKTIVTRAFANAQNNGTFIIAAVNALTLDITTTPLLAEAANEAREIEELDTGFVSFITNGQDFSFINSLGEVARFEDKDFSVAGLITSIKYKEPVRVATVINGTLATTFANGQTIDGIVLVTGNRILLKNQTVQSENGIYTVNATGVPTRAKDFDGNDEVLGSAAIVLEGTINSGVSYRLTNITAPTIGTTALIFKDVEDKFNYINIRTIDDWGTLVLAPDGVMRVPIQLTPPTFRIHNDVELPRIWMPTIPTPEQFAIVDFDFVNSSIVLFVNGDDTPHIWGRNMGALLCKEGNFVDIGNSEAGFVTNLFDLVGVDSNSLLAMQFTLFFGFKKLGHTVNVFHDHTDSLFSDNVAGFVVRNTSAVPTDHLVRAVTFRHAGTSPTPTKPVFSYLGVPNSVQMPNGTIDLVPGQDYIYLDSALNSEVALVGTPYSGSAKGNFFQAAKVKPITAQTQADIAIASFETGGAGKTKMVFAAIQDFTIGQEILIADEAAYDGLQTITAVDDDQKKFTFDVAFSTSGAGTLKMVQHTIATPNPYVRDATVTVTGTTSYNATLKILRETDTTFHLPQAFVANDATGSVTTNPQNEDTVGVKTLANGAQKDSEAIGSFTALNNSTETVINTINVWEDLNLNALAVITTSTSKSTLTNTTTGEMRYDDDNQKHGKVIASISAASSGGSQKFQFRVLVNGSPISDGIVASVEIGSNTIAVPLVVPTTLNQSDLVRIQVRNTSGTSNIVIEDITRVE